MQTVTPGASHLEATPIAYGTWQFGGDWESVDEQAAVAGLVREGLTRHVGGFQLQHGPDHRVRCGAAGGNRPAALSPIPPRHRG